MKNFLLATYACFLVETVGPYIILKSVHCGTIGVHPTWWGLHERFVVQLVSEKKHSSNFGTHKNDFFSDKCMGLPMTAILQIHKPFSSDNQSRPFSLKFLRTWQNFDKLKTITCLQEMTSKIWLQWSPFVAHQELCDFHPNTEKQLQWSWGGKLKKTFCNSQSTEFAFSFFFWNFLSKLWKIWSKSPHKWPPLSNHQMCLSDISSLFWRVFPNTNQIVLICLFDPCGASTWCPVFSRFDQFVWQQMPASFWFGPKKSKSPPDGSERGKTFSEQLRIYNLKTGLY